jgi:hypothetical protein
MRLIRCESNGDGPAATVGNPASLGAPRYGLVDDRANPQGNVDPVGDEAPLTSPAS